jgi:hypothetical protein
MSAAGPCSTTPAKSRPGVRGSVVYENEPTTFEVSLRLTPAARTRTSTSPASGAGTGQSAIAR